MGNAKTEATLRIAGNDLPITVQQILSITVSKELNKVPIARVIIKDGSANESNFAISNQDTFRPGAEMEVLLGEPEEKTTVFRGIVIRHGLKIRKDKPSVLVVECRDAAVRLTIGRKSRYFNDKSDSDIFEEVISEYDQLSVEAEDSSSIIQHPQIVQYYTSDWDFIAMRAEAIGQYLFVDDGTVGIRKPQLSATPKFTLAYGSAADTQEKSRIWEFESSMDARNQFAEVSTIGWDFSRQEVIQGTTSFSGTESGDISSDELVSVIGLGTYQQYHQARMDENELNAYADAIKQKSILNKIRGRIKFDGRGDVKPGDMLTLEGVGNRFNGNVFVARVHHSFEPGRWFTEILFGLPYCWFHEESRIQNPPASGLLPTISGLQLGKVVQLKDEENPDRDFRIKVTIPGVHQANEGIWARLATLYAGNQRGSIFLPEIDDEVLIGYIAEDSREPVILGSLFSQNSGPPLENDDNNYLKGIVSRNEHKIVIDEENNTITIESQGGNKITLDDGNKKIVLEDSHNNSILMEASGIKLQSGKDITIEASANVEIKGMSVNIVGQTDARINHPGGGMVKLGAGATPAAGTLDPISLPTLQIGPSKNIKVLI